MFELEYDYISNVTYSAVYVCVYIKIDGQLICLKLCHNLKFSVTHVLHDNDACDVIYVDPSKTRLKMIFLHKSFCIKFE